MVTWIRDLPVVVKVVSSFVGGMVATIVAIYGAIWGPLGEHEQRITALEEGSRIVVCWVHSQIAHTDPTLCLFPNNEPWSGRSGGGGSTGGSGSNGTGH
jgi:hypothetical protein